MGILYHPVDGVAADLIPFYRDGVYHLFYLKDYRDPEHHGTGTPWFHLETTDFVRFRDRGEAIPRGAPESVDRWVFTGSVIEATGGYHIYYTGHNPARKATGDPVQVVLRARSEDLLHWEKDTTFCLRAPAGHDPDDWRDPFLFRHPETGEFWMLLAARKGDGPSRYRGCVALAASSDLETWQVREPFWAPDLFFTHECPDLFRIADWWYLLYSTFSERHVTQYRRSRSLAGPWLPPPDDAFDARGYYAAKTAGDGSERFLFGWLATREGETDDGRWQWGGDLVVHQLVQRPDGTLGAHLPASIESAFDVPHTLSPVARVGAWSFEGDSATANRPDGLCAATMGDLPNTGLIRAELTYRPGTRNLGFLLRCGVALDRYYQVRFEPERQRVVVDRWPRPGDQPFLLERPCPLRVEESLPVRILVDGTCLVVYAGDGVALSCRMYDHCDGQWGLFVTEGQAVFSALVCRTWRGG